MPITNLNRAEMLDASGESLLFNDNKLEVLVDNPLKIGHAVAGSIANTEDTLDLTPLTTAMDYPMDIELESRDVACYVRQGASDVALSGVNARIQADQWRRITVEDETEAYVAFQNTATDETGTLVALRIDKPDA